MHGVGERELWLWLHQTGFRVSHIQATRRLCGCKLGSAQAASQWIFFIRLMESNYCNLCVGCGSKSNDDVAGAADDGMQPSSPRRLRRR